MNRARVFIVDDDRDFADSLALALEGKDCVVELAHTGEDAVRRFRESNFDVTFMDVRLPGQDGVDSFLEIRRHKPHARVVMMTGYSIQELLERAVENGAWDVLRKPLDMSQVLRIIEELPPHGILIADDDPDSLAGVEEILRGAGKRVLVARDGAEVLVAARTEQVDVLILDLRMPVLDGLETTLALREQGHVIPTIVVSAYIDEEQAKLEALRGVSVSGFLRKPFDPGDLLEAVREQLEGS